MPEVVTAIELDVPPQRAWEVLTDTARYREWSPIIKGLEGPLRLGGRVRGLVEVEGKPIRFDAQYSRVEKDRALAWKGPSFKFLHPLITGEHWFELMDLGNGRTRLVHGERFSGVLSQVESVWKLLEPRLSAAYEAHNAAFKRRVEARAS